MAAKRGREKAQRPREAETKLKGLLQTEAELESMLDEAKRRAREIIEEANERASRRLSELEHELQEQDQELRDRIARERDDAVEGIRTAAKEEVERLNGIRDDVITEVARELLQRLLAARQTRGSH